MARKKQSSRPGKSNVPMTHPEQMLAVHEQNYGHSVSWVELQDGRILLGVGGLFSISDDKGLTWSEAFQGRDEHGDPLQVGSADSLARLSGASIGLTYYAPRADYTNRYDNRVHFRRSEDEGKTWSPPTLINPGPTAFCLQDVLLRTSSGRLILPVYSSLGQGRFHQDGLPFVGGYVNGNFVTTDAHFYDPHFAACNVYYSDDEGQTWQRNRDGELFIILEDSRHFQSVAEPSVCEVEPGKLLMIMRTRVGRLYQAWSYNNGETWTRPQPTQLSSTQAPAQVRTLKNSGHLLCVFTQQSHREVRQGFIRTRLSSTISRNGGGVWEHFQNVESLHEETHVEPGPITVVRPEGGYPMLDAPATECDPEYVVPLPVGYGRWSYPSALVLDDRVLISYTYGYHDETGNRAKIGYNSKMKVLPLSWFYSGLDPNTPSKTLITLGEAARP